MQRDPAFFLLHATSSPIRTYKKSVVRHLLNAAKSCNPALWKQNTPPTVAMWLCIVEEIKKMEDLVLTAQHKQEKHSKNWLAWNMYIFSDEGKTLLNSWESLCWGSDAGWDPESVHRAHVGHVPPLLLLLLLLFLFSLYVLGINFFLPTSGLVVR